MLVRRTGKARNRVIVATQGMPPGALQAHQDVLEVIIGTWMVGVMEVQSHLNLVPRP